jgi:uncharacterized 2Fe-2S/4Fe-4S cluster protein (DUF4445 family)
MKTLTVISDGIERRIKAAEGTNLLEQLRASGFFVDAPCGGRGTCKKCGVQVGPQWRLACRTRVEADLTIRVPSSASFLRTEIGIDFEADVKVLDHSPIGGAIGPAPSFGVAVDLGTTTISIALLDLVSRSIVGTVSFYNPQIVYGADVINRIIFSLTADGRRLLQTVVVKEVERAIGYLCGANGASTDHIRAVAIAGNTTMQHLFLGLDARYIREEPYEPITRNFAVRPASELLSSIPGAELHLLPCVANYLGADMVAGAAACRLRESDGPNVLLDIGTNGEIIVGSREWLMGCACSAGPAFEGMGLSCGMRHKDGAITDVTVENGELHWAVEGGRSPAGISGTGAIGLIAGLKDLGYIDDRGRFTEKMAGKAGSRRAFVLHHDAAGKPVSMDEPDIDNIIRAKAAIFAGLTLLLKKLSLGFGDIRRFCVAGGIGSSLVMESAVKLGLLPPMRNDRIAFCGNTSLQGTMKYLVSERFRREVAGISRATTYVDLSYEPLYMDEFMAALFIPHTDKSLFELG